MRTSTSGCGVSRGRRRGWEGHPRGYGAPTHDGTLLMSDKFHGGILAGATSVTIPVVIRKTSDNTGRTALSAAAATLPASYWRQGASRVAVTLSNLASIAAAWAKGGFKQVHLSNMPGLYRLDLPNSACATGADFFAVGVKHSPSYVFFERYALESKNAE